MKRSKNILPILLIVPLIIFCGCSKEPNTDTTQKEKKSMDKFNKQFNSGSLNKAFNKVDSSAAANMPDSDSTQHDTIRGN